MLVYYNGHNYVTGTTTDIDFPENAKTTSVTKSLTTTANNATFNFAGNTGAGVGYTQAVYIKSSSLRSGITCIYNSDITNNITVELNWVRNADGDYDLYYFFPPNSTLTKINIATEGTGIGSIYVYTGSSVIYVKRNPKPDIGITRTYPNETKTLYNGKRVSIKTGTAYSEYDLKFDIIKEEGRTEYSELNEAIRWMDQQPCLLYISDDHIYHGQIFLDSTISENLSQHVKHEIGFVLTEVV
jgi:hypothetical protein